MSYRIENSRLKTVEEFRAAYEWIEDLLIDATERRILVQRMMRDKRDCTAVKKRHPLKNTSISTVTMDYFRG